jgi:hypothetical protein
MKVFVGQDLPTFERMSGFHAWNRFAAVNDNQTNVGVWTLQTPRHSDFD